MTDTPGQAESQGHAFKGYQSLEAASKQISALAEGSNCRRRVITNALRFCHRKANLSFEAPCTRNIYCNNETTARLELFASLLLVSLNDQLTHAQNSFLGKVQGGLENNSKHKTRVMQVTLALFRRLNDQKLKCYTFTSFCEPLSEI